MFDLLSYMVKLFFEMYRVIPYRGEGMDFLLTVQYLRYTQKLITTQKHIECRQIKRRVVAEAVTLRGCFLCVWNEFSRC